jgi:hypothetical protein
MALMVRSIGAAVIYIVLGAIIDLLSNKTENRALGIALHLTFLLVKPNVVFFIPAKK